MEVISNHAASLLHVQSFECASRVPLVTIGSYGVMIKSPIRDRQRPRPQVEITATLPLASATICLAYNALTVLLADHLPNDPFQLAAYIYIYALVGCSISIIGLYGITTRRAVLVKGFAQYLLIDAFVSVICRMLLEEFFMEALSESNVCGQTFDDAHWSLLNPGYAIVTSSRFEHRFKHMFSSSEGCSLGLAGLHFVAIGAMILTSAAQISLAVVMQQFGKQLSTANARRLWTILEVDEEAGLDDAYPYPIDEKHSQLR